MEGIAIETRISGDKSERNCNKMTGFPTLLLKMIPLVWSLMRNRFPKGATMTRILASALLVAGLATGASAQGITPVTETDLDVTVGTQAGISGGLLVAGFAVVVVGTVVADGPSGTR